MTPARKKITEDHTTQAYIAFTELSNNVFKLPRITWGLGTCGCEIRALWCSCLAYSFQVTQKQSCVGDTCCGTRVFVQNLMKQDLSTFTHSVVIHKNGNKKSQSQLSLLRNRETIAISREKNFVNQVLSIIKSKNFINGQKLPCFPFVFAPFHESLFLWKYHIKKMKSFVQKIVGSFF